MEELKRMLKAIHEENKTILSLLCSDDIKTTEDYIDGNDDQKDDCLDRQLKIIDSLSELLQARASIENNRKEVTNE